MTAATISPTGEVRRHGRIIHCPDNYSLGPVFIRDRDEAAATLRAWRHRFAGWHGYVHRRLRQSDRTPEQCRAILDCVAMDTAALLDDVEADTWTREREGQGPLRIADTEQVWLQLEDDRQGLAPLDGLQWNGLHSLTLRCVVADDDLRHVTHLTGLNRLFIEDDTTFTDAGLAHLSVLCSLKELELDSLYVTDDGLKVLRCMPALRSLHLCCPRISGIALAHLAGLKHLAELSLCLGEPLTDDAVPHLQELRSLRSLHANADDLSPAGEQALRDALPRCLFHFRHSYDSADNEPPKPPAMSGGNVWHLGGGKAWYLW